MSRFNFAQLIVSIVAILALLSNSSAQSTDRARLLDEIDLLRKEMSKKEEHLLRPAPEDATKFQSFLAQPDTGLIRLMPRELYDRRLIISGGGAYYSFIRLTHEYGRGSDIALERGRFSVGFAGLDWGFMASLPDTPIESVTLETEAVRFPAEFKAPQAEAEVRDWQRLSGHGFNRNGVEYKREAPAVVDTTYILKSIQYESIQSHRFSEVLVVFRPIRKDTDGSMIILWKILKRFPEAPNAPRVQVPQRVTLYPLPDRKVTLYPLPDRKANPLDQSKSCFDFRAGSLMNGAKGRWDLAYGFAILDYQDWFILSGTRETRTVIRDLGELRWTDPLEVRALKPLPELAKGEQRKHTIDTSGDTGDLWAKTTNTMAKVVIGHIYLMHIKDAESDFYVLFRVEDFKQQAFCTIAWEVIPTPEK